MLPGLVIYSLWLGMLLFLGLSHVACTVIVARAGNGHVLGLCLSMLLGVVVYM